MSISKRAIEKRLALNERMKNFISEKTISAINEELHHARTKFPKTPSIDRVDYQLGLLIREMRAMELGTVKSEFDLWNTGIIAAILIIRYLEEGATIYTGLRGGLESELDEIDKIARDNQP